VDWHNKTSAPGVAWGLPWGPWGSDHEDEVAETDEGHGRRRRRPLWTPAL